MPDVPLDGYPYFRDMSGNGMGVIDVPAKVLPVSKGGTGLDSYAIGDLLTADTTTTLTRLDAEPVGKVLISQGEDVMPVWGGVPVAGFSGTLTPANGGTGTSTVFTQGSIVFAGVGGNYAQDNTNFNYNDTTNTVGLGGLAFANRTLSVSKTITGGGNAFGVVSDGVTLSDVTGSTAYYRSIASTQATPFTQVTMRHFEANQGVFGAGSIVSNQTGFMVSSSLTGATNNYGFFGDIAAGANRWNFYANGTAANYFAGPTSVGADPVLPMEVATKQYVDTKTSGSVPLLTPGSVPFADGAGQLTQDNPNLFWNDTVNGLGIGTTSVPAGQKLVVGGNLTGSSSPVTVHANVTIQSDATSTPVGFRTNLNTLDAAFNIANMHHFQANQATIGASSTISSQNAFYSGALTAATANHSFRAGDSAAVGAGKTSYAFHSGHNVATGGGTTWAFYGAGTANSYMGGSLGIGTSDVSAHKLRIGGTITGGTNRYAVVADGIIQSDVTSSATYFRSSAFTAAAAFTVPTLLHFQATQPGSFGAGSAVTTQVGFQVAGNLVGAGTNYGFQSSIPAGANRYNFYADGTADNYMAGSLNLGTPNSFTTVKLHIGGSLGGGTVAYGSYQDAIVGSGVTNSAVGYATAIATQAAAFNCPSLTHFSAAQAAIGAGSSVTTQIGFVATSSLVGATNNYGFYGDIPVGTGCWNLYMPGTADNYIAGKLSIGTPIAGDSKLRISGIVSTALGVYGIYADPYAGPGNTTLCVGIQAAAGTQAAAFNVGTLQQFRADQGVLGAGSTVTSQSGFVAASTLTGATNNYGFYGDVPVGTNRWNFFGGGAAQNAFAGNTTIGSTAVPTATLEVVGNEKISGAAPTLTLNPSTATGDCAISIDAKAAGAAACYNNIVFKRNAVTIGLVQGTSDGTNHYMGHSADIHSWSNSASAVAYGSLRATTGLIINAPIRTQSYTVATLPSAAACGAGARAMVNDATSATFGTAAAGGSTNSVPVFVNHGNVWVIG